MQSRLLNKLIQSWLKSESEDIQEIPQIGKNRHRKSTDLCLLLIIFAAINSEKSAYIFPEQASFVASLKNISMFYILFLDSDG